MTATGPDRATLRARLAGLVSVACDGEVTAAEAAGWSGALAHLGVGSLAQMRLLDAVETEYGVCLDVDGPVNHLSTLDSLADHLVDVLCGQRR
jgi:hypothetical protein